MAAQVPLPPGSTIGILGGGQLGRMLALAAARLGLGACILCPEADSPAGAVAAASVVAAYDDEAVLDRFAAQVDAVTYEFENIPVATVEYLAARKPMRPGATALRLTQDRLAEKTFLNDIGLETAPFAAVDTPAGLAVARTRLGAPAILKSRRFGYDGKGQARVSAETDPAAAWAAIGARPAILEGLVRFAREISVVAARGLDGRTACYDPIENLHRDHILHTSQVPAAIDAATVAAAHAIAGRILAALDYVGVLAVELFVAEDGRLLVNEIAPRVHNSGHLTLDACAVSQFEQHVRAVCGWPLGATARHSDATMVNLIGAEVEAWRAIAAEPGAALHLYGKAEARPGRKMGHVTRLYPLGSRQGSTAGSVANGLPEPAVAAGATDRAGPSAG
jgi:5-(carboxyamino)imidazole ribonucleotide synthase